MKVLNFPITLQKYFVRRYLNISSKSLLRIVPVLLFTLAAILFASIPAIAQKQNQLTDAEDMQLREAMELDARMKIFIKVIERRLLAINDPNAAQSKQIQKDVDSWGELRTAERDVLLFDIQRTIDEAIAKIDDAAERDQKNPLFPKAVKILADGCGRIIPHLNALKLEAEKENIFRQNSVDSCNQVIAATSKLPKDVAAEEKKRKKN